MIYLQNIDNHGHDDHGHDDHGHDDHGHDDHGHNVPWTTNHHGPDHHDHEEHGHHGYPIAELILCAGFFLIFWIEAIADRVLKGTHGSHGHSHGVLPSMIQNDNLHDNECQEENKRP